MEKTLVIYFDQIPDYFDREMRLVAEFENGNLPEHDEYTIYAHAREQAEKWLDQCKQHPSEDYHRYLVSAITHLVFKEHMMKVVNSE